MAAKPSNYTSKPPTEEVRLVRYEYTTRSVLDYRGYLLRRVGAVGFSLSNGISFMGLPIEVIRFRNGMVDMTMDGEYDTPSLSRSDSLCFDTTSGEVTFRIHTLSDFVRDCEIEAEITFQCPSLMTIVDLIKRIRAGEKIEPFERNLEVGP